MPAKNTSGEAIRENKKIKRFNNRFDRGPVKEEKNVSMPMKKAAGPGIQ